MPTYEFRCPRGHEFEKFYRTIGSAESRAACPQCAEPGERLMSPAGFAFKGSGFYLTDYGKNAHREKAPTDARAGAAPEGGSEAAKSEKSETKADTAAPAATSSEAKPAAEPKKRDAKAAEAKPPAPAKKSANE